jgi:hypothetical protein
MFHEVVTPEFAHRQRNGPSIADNLDLMIHLRGLRQLDRDEGVTAYPKPDLKLRCVCR